MAGRRGSAVVGVRDRGFVGARSGARLCWRAVGRRGRGRVIGRAGTAPQHDHHTHCDHRCHCEADQYLGEHPTAGGNGILSGHEPLVHIDQDPVGDLERPIHDSERTLGGRDPPTRLIDPFLPNDQCVLNMSRHGFLPLTGGQPFHPSTVGVGKSRHCGFSAFHAARVARWHAWRVDVPFNRSAGPSVGIEWEIALVDPYSGDLVSRADEIFDLLGDEPADGPRRIHRELLLNTVELVTGICQNVPEAMADLAESMARVREAAESIGIDLFSAGMHPFASWQAQRVTNADRYATLIDRTQYWGRQMLIYGVHVHVGMTDRDRVLPVLNSLLRYYPHLQALSASSPFYDSTDTGYASNRALLFQQLPTAGLPFQFEEWSHYESYVEDMMVTGVIDHLNEIRWDIRPSPTLGTIEVRVCDAMATFDEVAAIAALIHCLIVDLDDRLASGEQLPTLPPWHIQENKWRSARYGMDSIIILNSDNREHLMTEDLTELLEQLAPVARRLQCADELAGVSGIVERGAGYERQRAVSRATRGDLSAVVSTAVAELRESQEAIVS